MPFVRVCPRLFWNQPTNRPAFRVNVQKFRAAFEWLKHNNAHYHNNGWIEASVAKWEEAMQPNTEVHIGRDRFQDFSDQALPVDGSEFRAASGEKVPAWTPSLPAHRAPALHT